jgi:hypothetical protein
VDPAYAIVDDFLSSREHGDLRDAFQHSAASPIAAREWNRVYQLTSGEEPVSSAFAARGLALHDGTGDGEAGPPAQRVFIEKLFALMTGGAPPLSFDPWTGFSSSAWTYPSGTGLEWHSDTGWLAGYIYYMHPAWRAAWGGELLVATDGPPSPAARVESVCESGGVFIYPRPNRLVLLRGGTLHCIKKVESTAGGAARTSVSGFFFNTPGVGDRMTNVRVI